MKQFLNVLKFEYLTICKNKSFMVSTTLLLLIIVIISCVPTVASVFGNVFSGGDDSGEVKTAYINDVDGVYTNELLAESLATYNWQRGEITDEVKAKVETGEYQFALRVEGINYTLYLGTSDSSSSRLEKSISAMIQDKVETTVLGDFGLSLRDIQSYKNIELHSEVVVLGKNFQYTFVYAYVLLMLLYMTILMYGQFVITSVATEKSTKTMELLITSVKPTILMFGKVIGIGLAGLTQFLLILIVGGVGLSLNLSSWIGFSDDIGQIISFALSSNLFVFAIIFFLLGFFQYAFVYAAFGSTISRLEEASSVTVFPMFLFIAAFMVSMFGMSSGASAGYMTVLSYVPFFSPLVMFMRMCVTEVVWFEVAVAIVINLTALVATGILGGRIYKIGVMMYGNPPNFRTIMKYMIKG